MSGDLESLSPVDLITNINTHEFLVSFGLGRIKSIAGILNRILQPLARNFARHIVAFDEQVGREGLQKAAKTILDRTLCGLRIDGMENIPNSGPLVVLSNHPGLTDVLILFASIRRPDLRVVAQERPFLHAMAATSQRLIFVPQDIGSRLDTLLEIKRHLNGGGAILTFPSGRIEPDPSSMEGARDSLARWSDSMAAFYRMAPPLAIVPAVVSGVVSRMALKHPLTRLRKQKRDRERLALTLQILVNVLRPSQWPVYATVQFGRPIIPSRLGTKITHEDLNRMVTYQVSELMTPVIQQ